MHQLTEQVLTGGVDFIRKMVDERWEETLHLEFKILGNWKGDRFEREDKERIAKAICGLANADGGIVLIGVKTKTFEEVDFADRLAPIKAVESFRNRLVGQLQDMINPLPVGISIHSIEAEYGEGFLLVDVPISDLRPHMSLPAHVYYRRSGTQSRYMEHGEIKDIILARRDAKLRFMWKMRHHMSSQLSFAVQLELGLVNVGSVAARAPYISLMKRPEQFATGTFDGIKMRGLYSGSVGFFADRNTLIHVDEYLQICSIKTHFTLMDNYISNPVGQLRSAIDSRRDTIWISYKDYPPGEDGTNILPSAELYFGAENSARERLTFAPSRDELFDMLHKLNIQP